VRLNNPQVTAAMLVWIAFEHLGKVQKWNSMLTEEIGNVESVSDFRILLDVLMSTKCHGCFLPSFRYLPVIYVLIYIVPHFQLSLLYPDLIRKVKGTCITGKISEAYFCRVSIGLHFRPVRAARVLSGQPVGSSTRRFGRRWTAIASLLSVWTSPQYCWNDERSTWFPRLDGV
jgi:hypothetical protein